MWPELIPLIGENIVPILSGLTAAGQTLSQTGDPLKALLVGGGTGVGGAALGKLGAGLGASENAVNLQRMAGEAVDAPGLAGQAAQILSRTNLPTTLKALGYGVGAPLTGAVVSKVTDALPSARSVANTALGAGGLAYNTMQPKPTGNIPTYRPPNLDQYGPNGPYGATSVENPLSAWQEALRYQREQGRADLDVLKTLTPYQQQVARQAYDEEMQRQAASYQQKSAINTAATMLGQAQLGGQQAGLNAQQAINAAISGPQRSYF